MWGKTVTLYIDDTNIRLLTATGKRIRKWADLPLEAGLIKGGVVLNEEEVANKIKQMLKAQNVKPGKVILGSSGLHSLTRPIILPQLPKAMIAEAVTREARRLLPVPLDQLYIAWQSIPAPRGRIQVFLAAIPRKTADSQIKTVNRAGLTPCLMSVKPLVLTRVVKEETAIIVDIQPSEFDIVIMIAGIPQPVRTVSLPPEALSWQEKVNIVVADLDRTIIFYNSNHKEKILDDKVPLYVSGELANEPELQKAIAVLGFPIKNLIAPMKLPGQLDPRRYMANLALTYQSLVSKEFIHPVEALNILPAPYQPKPVSPYKIAVIPGVVSYAVLIVIFAILLKNTAADLENTKLQLENTNQQIKLKQTHKQGLNKDIARLEKTLASTSTALKTMQQAVDELVSQQSDLNSNLQLSLSAVPAGITIGGISYSDGRLVINGQAARERDVLTYARSLDSSQKFSETTVATIKNTAGSGIDFTLSLKEQE